ncbi:ribonuclease H-like domain-containing protein, partial [Lineolata rhizophorae]
DHIRLPDGRMVCAHGFTVCGLCTVDYSFMDELEDEPEDQAPGLGPDGGSGLLSVPLFDEPDERRVKVRQDGIQLAHRFFSDSEPKQLYFIDLVPDLNDGLYNVRFFHQRKSGETIIFTDGCCIDNGRDSARAAWGFAHRRANAAKGITGGLGGRLEKQGPTGEVHPQTSNRAELRAVIAALEVRSWWGEGIRMLTIATDSSYVVEGITHHIRKWAFTMPESARWKTAARKPVKNRDLWETLLAQVQGADRIGLKIQFWLIPRSWNTLAHNQANEAVAEPFPEMWTQVVAVAPF